MEQNILTAREIFDQLTVLQRQLTENSQTSLHRLSDAIGTLEDAESEDRCSQIADICDVFKTRELNLLKILELYERMYDDIQNAQSKRAALVARAFDQNMAYINEAEMNSEDKFAALGYVTDKIAELTAQVLAAQDA